jgi:2-oxoisovalerate dehydrogenase E1 component
MLVDAGRIAQAARDVLAGRPPVPHRWTGGAGAAAPARAAPAAGAASAARAAAAAPVPGVGEPITMPFGDLTVSEGRIVRWLKQQGDPVSGGDLVAEIETDKAVVEIEAPCAGILGAIEAPAGTVVPMGGRIGTVRPA